MSEQKEAVHQRLPHSHLSEHLTTHSPTAAHLISTSVPSFVVRCGMREEDVKQLPTV